MVRKIRIAGTQYDRRWTLANAINAMNEKCSNGHPIKASQVGTGKIVEVKVSCGCRVIVTTMCFGCIGHLDAYANFRDEHDGDG